MKQQSKQRVRLAVLALTLSALFLAAACEGSARDEELEATVEALAAENATLSVAAGTPAVEPAPPAASVGEPGQLAAAAEPTPCPDDAEACAVDVSGLAGLQPVPPIGQSPAVFASTLPENPVPRVIKRIPLVSDGATLLDFQLDAATNTGYLTDSSYRLHVVDLQAGAEVAVVQVSGDRLTLDAANSRLYIVPDNPYAEDAEPTVTVFDTTQRSIVGTLPGGRVSVDSARNRLYVGDLVSLYDEDSPGVRLYDGATLEQAVTGELAGDPLYNPKRDELLITNYSVYAADPNTLAVREDLTPDVTAQQIRGCNGCIAAEESFYFPEQGLLGLYVTTLATGGGPGRMGNPRFLDAATLEPASEPVEFRPSCSSQPVLHTLMDGAILDHELYVRYIVHNNVTLRDAAGNELLFKDGLLSPFPNPATGVGYLQDSYAATYVIDRSTLSPVGIMESFCFFARDDASGLLYATDPLRALLVVLEETGGESSALPGGPHILDGHSIDRIIPSPNFAQDNTLFILTWSGDQPGQIVARSRDGGATWTRLGGGLPVGDDLMLTLAASPTFATDSTLFVGGFRRDAVGEGVWRSTDGGDTWLPHWVGLEHLRVQRIEVSPRFAQDGAVLAYAPFDRIIPYENGYSLHRSADGGITWTKVITAESSELLPAPSAYLPIAAEDLPPIKKESWRYPLMVHVQGAEWMTVTAPFAEAETIRAALAAPPDEPDRGTRDLFVVTDVGIYRSADGGVNWQQWQDERLAGRTYENDLRSAALTPRLADGSYRMLIGTGAGELWQLDPASMSFVDLAPAVPAPAASAPITAEQPDSALPTPTPAAPAATPAATPAASPTPPPALDATAPAGLFVPQGIFQGQWAADPLLQQQLGYARTEQPRSMPGAYQFFEKGVMVWRSDTSSVLVFLNDSTWESYPDTFKEGEMERDPNIYTPGELLQPVRGFGKLWRTQEELREAIGWGTAEEQGITIQVQEFERGAMLRVGGLTYAFFTTPEGKFWRP